MISIIVSSYKNDLFSKFHTNVMQTIGNIRYEIIQMYNPGKMGISQAYNEGAAKAKYSYLVFSHEDIIFHTFNWGSIIKQIFEQEPLIGLIGCAGGLYKSQSPTGWSLDEKSNSVFMIGTHYGSSYVSRTYKGISRSYKLNDKKEIPEDFRVKEIVNEEVLMLDGMFLSTKKYIHELFPFDQHTFKKFHSYDLDLSLQINKIYKVVVNHNILIEHFSPGKFNLEWLEEMNQFNKKWKNILPYSLYPISNSYRNTLEFRCFEQVLRVCNHQKISLMYAFKYFIQWNYIKKLGIMNWLILFGKIIKKSVKLISTFHRTSSSKSIL